MRELRTEARITMVSISFLNLSTGLNLKTQNTDGKNKIK
jgi:hypothetical protein